jgi:hypothetical protein
MAMSAKAVKVERGWYESPSPRRKVDADRVRQIIEREAPTPEPSQQHENEPSNGTARSS